MSRVRSRCWVFTLNNPEDDSLQLDWEGLRYRIYQKEVGDNETPHLQGYVQWENPVGLPRCRRCIPRAHWEIAKGSLEQNKKYCSKEEGRLAGPWEHGEALVQGQRRDLDALKEILDEGGDVGDCFEVNFSSTVRYHRGLQYYVSQALPVRREKTLVTVLLGPSGCGKTRDVYVAAPTCYVMPLEFKWYDGYLGQGDVLFDDFSGNMRLTELLKVLDRYPLTVPIKGGHVNFAPKRIFITTNIHPRRWYQWLNREQQWEALKRRIDLIKIYNQAGESHRVTGIEFFGQVGSEYLDFEDFEDMFARCTIYCL